MTMLLGGLWHGANWTFIAWGAYQGLWLVVERLNEKRPLWWWAPRPVQMAASFVVVLVGWVLFRAPTLPGAMSYLGKMADVRNLFSGVASIDIRSIHILMLIVGGAITWLVTTTQNVVKAMPPARVLMAQAVFILALLQLLYQENVPFLYFQF